ncbi:hypothetical protein V7x_24660 [Crateriforma conspicua]|uniref:Uncharacterized protein n=1 Tax=Crateriforma conspicua TaxID=2527996 RepID=A0A5C6FZ48_9PLAN|nr:hypothetical protein [Crateriforma conspicua]TWU66895.1 hypothetical protein V7x_24660 [Crateriforma conspicua]
MSTTDTDVTYYDHLEIIQAFPIIKIPHGCMVECGPAAQTMGGILRVTSRETFRSIAYVANHAILPVTTVKKHLRALADHGYIERQGRQRTDGGVLRRTATVKVTSKSKRDHFGILPSWVSCPFRDGHKLSWASRAVLSVVLQRLSGIATADHIDDLGDAITLDESRFEFGLKYLEDVTGLTRHSVIKAKRELEQYGVTMMHDDGLYGRHIIYPSFKFAVKATPAGFEKFHLQPLIRRPHDAS